MNGHDHEMNRNFITTGKSGLHPVVVLPALNEGANILATCASLEFGRDAADIGAHLVLVDNGSTDDTRAAMTRVAAKSAIGTVSIVEEPVRGYVPARVAGIECARCVAADRNWPEAAVFIIQVDADTRYLESYVARMTSAAERAGPGHLVEGCSVAPTPEEDRCPDFRAFEAAIDGRFDGVLDLNGPDDVVVDDKTAGYRLSDYLAWGGHRREYTVSGDEILAETTRLFMRAKRLGARRTHVDDALAVTSQRRILENPALAFATAGFPRNAGWTARWGASYRGARDLGSFRVDAPGEGVAESVLWRSRHLVAMFGLLPLVVGSPDPRRFAILGKFGLDGADFAASEPGVILERLFTVMDEDVSGLLEDFRPRSAC